MKYVAYESALMIHLKRIIIFCLLHQRQIERLAEWLEILFQGGQALFKKNIKPQ